MASGGELRLVVAAELNLSKEQLSERKHLRSSASHLAEQTRALGRGLDNHGLLRSGRSLSVRRSSHSGGRPNLLGRRSGIRDGRARGSASDGSLTRHFGVRFVVVKSDRRNWVRERGG